MLRKKNTAPTVRKVSVVSIIVNIGLFGFKLFAGLVTNSSAMVSDAIHSLSDVLSTFIVLIGVHLSKKESDKEHQYGHERMECVAAILLAVVLLLSGIAIGYNGIKKIFLPQNALPVTVDLALFAAVVSIIVKEAMFWYTRNAAQKIDSCALMADAWHHRSDALSSIGSFIGVLGVHFGMPIFDPLACVVICFFIIKASYDIFRDAISKMDDHACKDEMCEKIEKIILSVDGVRRLDELKTRLFGAKIYVDVEISCDADMRLKEAHDIAVKVHDRVEEIENIKHVSIHVNPYEQ